MIIWLTALLLAGLAGPSHLIDAEQIERELLRLAGQSVERTETGYRILDIAQEGPPMVGCIRRQEESLIFVNSEVSLRLEGPLAVPRIAGPDYKVWVLGQVRGNQLHATRLGILSRPNAGSCASQASSKQNR